MRALVKPAAGPGLEMAEVPAPAPGPAEVLIRIRKTSICGTDLHIFEWDEWAARYGSFAMEDEPDRPFAPGGDSWTTFHERVGRVLAHLACEHEGRTVVAVSHGGVIAASMRLLLGHGPAGTGRVQPTNTGVTEWEWEPEAGRWTLHAFNETAHLLGPTPDTEPEPRTTNDPLG